ncbi:MAG: AI-2E family transporter [Candidatus Sulfobium sp.]
MTTNRFYFLMLLFLLAVLGYLTFEIMRPFLNAIGWSVVLSIVFYPVYAAISRYVRLKSVASVITVFLIVIIIIGPISYLTFMLVNEIQVIAQKINQNGLESLRDLINQVKSFSLFDAIRSYTGIQDIMSEQALTESVRKLGNSLLQFFSLRITNIISSAVDFIFMVFAVFFLLRDGPGFLSKARDYMPFSETQKNVLASQINDTIISTVYGGVVIAIIQGVLGGFAFYVIGIESPVLWGVAMSIMSFVPLLGTFAVWGPTSVYLVVKGSFMEGVGLFLFGVLVISMVDNILKPLIIGSRTKMHTLIILFSVLGGIKLFGMIGLIMGPLITALFVSVFEISRNIETGGGDNPPSSETTSPGE